MVEGEFKKRLFQDQAQQLETGTYHGHGLDFIIQMFEDAKKDLPRLDAVRQAITMVSELFPEEHAFSKRYILNVLKETETKIIKYFGEK